jgi:DNA-binding NtrC family response regulator
MNSNAEVLIIDDDRELRDLLYCTLKKTYAVATIGDAVEAISYLTNYSVNVVLLDFNMSKIDGITTLVEIKKNHPDTEIIMMADNASSDIRDKALNLGAFAFLIKPLHIGELIKTIDAARRGK